MRVKLLFLIIILIFSVNICFGIDVYLGIAQGVNAGMHYLNEADMGKNGLIFGFNGGFQANVIITELIGIEADVLVSIRGGKVNDSNFSGEIRLTYIDIPLLFKLRKNVGWSILNINTGLQLSFNLNGYWQLDNDDVPVQTEELNTRIIDLGVTAGAGMIFPVRNFYFSIEFRTTMGFLSTFAEMTNRNLQMALLAGYGFKL